MYITTAGHINLGLATGPGSTYRLDPRCKEWEELMDAGFHGGCACLLAPLLKETKFALLCLFLAVPYPVYIWVNLSSFLIFLTGGKVNQFSSVHIFGWCFIELTCCYNLIYDCALSLPLSLLQTKGRRWKRFTRPTTNGTAPSESPWEHRQHLSSHQCHHNRQPGSTSRRSAEVKWVTCTRGTKVSATSRQRRHQPADEDTTSLAVHRRSSLVNKSFTKTNKATRAPNKI